MSKSNTFLQKMKVLDNNIVRLGQIAALLDWDHETNLPERAVENRASQLALIAGLQHDAIVDESWKNLFDALQCSEDGCSPQLKDVTDSALVRECYKRWIKKTRVPKKLVEEMAQSTSLAQSAWINARKSDDFSAFQPHLENIIRLKKEYARTVGPSKDEYDVLLDEYEPGAKGDQIAAIFDSLAEGLKVILNKIENAEVPDTSFLQSSYQVNQQDKFGRMIQKYIGYDFKRGRLDLSPHPFTTNLGPDDVRVTTRYDDKLLLSGLFSNIHEAGHGLYEQGIARELHNSILGEGASLGFHESQSRFWENMVGRSLVFWEKYYGHLQNAFSPQLGSTSVASFHKAVNKVSPSLIRVEADEVTYSFHIIIRFRLERAMIRGEFKAADLPEAWRKAYRDILGIRVPNDADGCLQDVHWSSGLFGYFPTYALGNLYAAQFSRVMEKELGSLESLIRDDKVSMITEWLKKNIHLHGRVYGPQDLCIRISGEELNPKYFLDYLGLKYATLFNI